MEEEFISKIIEQDEAQVKIKMIISTKVVDKNFTAIYRDMASQVKIPGYKPSKIPKQLVLKEMGGQEVLQEEVCNALVNYYTPKALEHHKLSPINVQVNSQHPIEGQDHIFYLEVDLYPRVILPKLEDIGIETKAEQITDDMVRQKLADLSMQNALYIPVDNQLAKDNDLVYLQWFNDSAQNLLPIDLHVAPTEVTQQLKGKGIGEVFNITLPTDFLEDLHSVNLFADPSSPEVMIKEIKTCHLPQPDEDFAKTLGFDSWAETEKSLRKNLQEDLDEQVLQMQMDELLEKLVAKTETKLPKIFIEHHKNFLLEEFTHELNLNGQEKTLEEYLNQLKKENKYEAFIQDLEEEASKQTKKDLVLETLVIEQEITLSKEEFDQSLEYIANDEGITVSQLKQQKGQNWLTGYHFSLVSEKALLKAVQKLINGIKSR